MLSGQSGGGHCTEASCADGGAGIGGDTGSASGGSSGSAPDTGSGSNGESPEVIDCAKVDVQAELVKKPVDIVWAIDSSGSMDNEAAIVQQNMNAFAATIAGSGIDYRVVVITRAGFVNVPDPLGSDAAHFLFVDEDVASDEALDVLVDTFDRYGSFLRPSAVTHLVAVTDDEARKEGGLFSSNRVEQTRDWFVGRMSRLLRHDFILHAVASEVAGTGVLGNKKACKGAAAPGEVYYALAAETSGLTFSICSSDWTSLFTQLATAVSESSGVSCNIPMPEPPPGLALNPEQVSITYTPGGGQGEALARVASEAGCTQGGWYFDRPLLPRFIQLCESTCSAANADRDAEINVSVDCGSNACAGVGAEADVRETPVDIVWVIDSSGSMDNEATIVQDNLNDFAAEIDKSGIDYRVVVVTTQDFVFVPDPLGSDSAHFLFVEEKVSSNEPLDALLERFGDPAMPSTGYGHFLRPDAVTHIIAVTDDEARQEGGSATSTRDWFITQMEQKLGHPFTFHAIASEDTGNGTRCSGPNGNAAEPGLTYIALSEHTMGQFYSICSSDWTSLFDGLVRAVLSSSPIQCDFPLPEPPAGKTFDQDEVNVLFAAHGAGSVTVLGRTTGSDKCQQGGWHYDDADAPTRIVLCASTCDDIQGEFDGAIEIKLGCATEIVVE